MPSIVSELSGNRFTGFVSTFFSYWICDTHIYRISFFHSSISFRLLKTPSHRLNLCEEKNTTFFFLFTTQNWSYCSCRRKSVFDVIFVDCLDFLHLFSTLLSFCCAAVCCCRCRRRRPKEYIRLIQCEAASILHCFFSFAEQREWPEESKSNMASTPLSKYNVLDALNMSGDALHNKRLNFVWICSFKKSLINLKWKKKYKFEQKFFFIWCQFRKWFLN